MSGPSGIGPNPGRWKWSFPKDLVDRTLAKFPRFKPCPECGKMLARDYDWMSADYEHVNVVYSPYSGAMIYDVPKAFTQHCPLDDDEIEISDIECEVLKRHKFEGYSNADPLLSEANMQVLQDEVSSVLKRLVPGQFAHWYDVAVNSPTIEHFLFTSYQNDYYLTNPKIKPLINSLIAGVTAADKSNYYECRNVKPVFVRAVQTKLMAGPTDDKVLVWANLFQADTAGPDPASWKILKAWRYHPSLESLDDYLGKEVRLLSVASESGGGELKS